MRINLRITRVSFIEPGTAALHWLLQNIDVHRITEPPGEVRDEDYWTYHAEDLSSILCDA